MNRTGTVNQAWSKASWNQVRTHFRGVRMVGAQAGEPVRAGSYAFNLWLLGGGQLVRIPSPVLSPQLLFGRKDQIREPSFTPVVSDGVDWWVAPRATDAAPLNLVTGAGGQLDGEMRTIAVPRHGRRPSPVPEAHPKEHPLPGAVNVAFFDGHVEVTPLETLWQLRWHRDYEPPLKRPGLR